MSATNKYILKGGIMDVGAGNRLNCIMNNTMQLEPSMFVDSGSLVDLTSFSTVDVYNVTNCTGTKISSTRIDITPSSSSTFSFCLTNGTGDPLINGFALVALGTTNISINTVRIALSETTYVLKNLCTSTHLNIYSPLKPNGYSPYHLGDFRGYCASASGGVNLYDPNGGIITYGSTYFYYACGTKNQVNYTLAKIEIFENGTSKGYVTKSLTTNQYIEYKTSTFTNSSYSDTALTIQAIASYSSDGGSTWNTITTDSASLTLKGLPTTADLQLVTINTVTVKLGYTYVAHNNTSGSLPFRIRLMNVTNSTPWVSSTDVSVSAGASSTLSGLLTLSATNVAGNTFDASYSTDNGTTWSSLNGNSVPYTLNFNYLA